MQVLETYLRDLFYVRAMGAAVPETSYYGSLEKLFNEVGKGLKPRVHCVINIQNTGAGIPDGGLFTADQLQRGAVADMLMGQLPSRGAIEVKGTGEGVEKIAADAQVKKYLGKYGQVLVTNLWDFVLVGVNADGTPNMLERYSLAEDESGFWRGVTTGPQRVAEEHGEPFVEYLKRVMLYRAPLAAPVDVAWFLASYARDAKARIERAGDVPALKSVRRALEGALGLQFEGEKGTHFFRSTLVQTLFYGMFSAWVLWSKKQAVGGKEVFDWKDSGWYLRVPVIQALFEEIGKPATLRSLDLVDVMDWAGAALNRVNKEAFFARFEEEHAVQYFYEPFLEAFDPQLRKDLGVWYTPPEIVKYMVARVDRVLREELGIEDGLADKRVTVLDPACGTGAYLVEVLRQIEATLRAKGEGALLGHELKQAVMGRVYGFEILPAPYVVAHLQMGVFLQGLGAPLSEKGNERAGVYLTNSLTGWDPLSGSKQHLLYPELEEERDAAEKVKQGEEILVVIGNPPYNAFSGTSPEEEKGLVEPYKEGLISKWGIKKFNLDDLYVRFFRLAERRIAEMNSSRRGVVCYISNHSWVSDPSFVVLREHLLSSFDRFWVENMHGNRKISEYAPDGRTSETIFAISGFSPGIQQGVAISLWVKSGQKHDGPQVLFRDDLDAARASERRAQLLESLTAEDFDGHYEPANPSASNRFSFKPSDASAGYLAWPKLGELSVLRSDGLFEKRGGALIDIDRKELEERIKMYYDPSIDWEILKAAGTALTDNASDYDAKKVRPKVQRIEQYEPRNIRRYMVRPFDVRWCYYSNVSPLWNRSRPDLWAQSWEGNGFVVSRLKTGKTSKGSPMLFSSTLFDGQAISVNPAGIPLRLQTAATKSRPKGYERPTFLTDEFPTANLSSAARAYLASIGISDPDVDAETAGLVWMHALAVGYSPAYLSENADGIRQDWPRVPLPNSKEALVRSAALGKEVAGLLDTERDVKGVTTGVLRPEMREIGSVQRVSGGQLNPDAGDLEVRAGWGHAGKEGVTMPGRGTMVERGYTAEERAAIEAGAVELGLSVEEAFGRLGERTYDIYLNKVAYWRNVPEKVWGYTIGGYQVMKKWLSYREYGLLGRGLTPEEVGEVTKMARRIGGILLLEGRLDENYWDVKGNAYSWPGSSHSSGGG